MTCLASRRPDHYHEPAAEPTNRDKPSLAVVASLILELQGSSLKDERGVGEIQLALPQRPEALGRIEAYDHYRSYKKGLRQSWRDRCGQGARFD